MNVITKFFRAAAACAIVVSAVGCTTATYMPPNVEQQLISADKAYEAYNRKHGFNAASMKFIDFNVAFMIEAGDGFVVGEEAILEARALADVPSPVTWEPIGAMAAESADFGITWGVYSVNGTTQTTGHYVTVWRNEGGKWKIVTDVAVDNPTRD